MIRRLRRTGPALLLLAGLALSGCAGVVSRADCQTGDWHRIGEARGLAGRTLDVESIREACAGHGGRVDEGLLRAGYVAGTRQYCQPTAIRQRVFDGERVNPAICPADLAEAAEAAVYEGQGARETWAETWDTRGRLRLLAIYWGAGSAAEQLLDEYLAGRLASQCRDRFRQVASMMAWPADRRPGWRTACGLGSVPFAAVEEADPRLEQALAQQRRDLSTRHREALAEVERSNAALAELYAYSREQGETRDAVDASITARSLRERCRRARDRAVAQEDPLYAYGGRRPDPPPACD